MVTVPALVGAMIDEMRELYEGPRSQFTGHAGSGCDRTRAHRVERLWSVIAMARRSAAAASNDCRTGRARSSGCMWCRPRVATVSRGFCCGALQDAARDLGYDIARLDTGPRQPHARGLYESEGYVAIGNFNGNPVATFFGEKRLSG